MSVSLSRDIGAFLAGRFAGGVAATAGGAGDNTEVNGPWIDRQGFDSCKVIVGYTATLAQDATLTIAANLQDASDSSGTGAADFGTAVAAAVQATGGAGGSTETGEVELDIDLTGADRYVRLQFTPDLSAANTDTAVVMGIVALGGATNPPVTARANA